MQIILFKTDNKQNICNYPHQHQINYLQAISSNQIHNLIKNNIAINIVTKHAKTIQKQGILRLNNNNKN